MDASASGNRNLGKTLVVYLGTAGVFIELFNFIVDKYQLQGTLPDVLVILVIFGLPAALIHEWHNRKFTRKAIWIHLLNLTIAIGVIAYGYFNPNHLRPTELRLLQFRKSQKELASSVRSIAILPFANLTGDPDQEVMARGMHDELIGQMGTVSGLRIISRTSSEHYAGTDKSLHEIADELQVDAIVEGSMLPAAGTELKIQLRLIGDMPRELQLWTKSFELEKEKVLSLYDDIVQSITDEINMALSPEEEDKLETSKAIDPEAYEYYLRGKFNLSFLTPQLIETAAENFRESLEIDPGFAPAYAGLAGVWVARKQLPFFNYPPEVTEPKIAEYIQKSFALDSTDAEIWRWHATRLAYDYKWEECNKALDRCLELNPNFAEAHAFNAHFLMMQSRWESAWEHIGKAQELDPKNPLILNFYRAMLVHSGQVEALRETFKGAENEWGIDYLYFVENKYDSLIHFKSGQLKGLGLPDMALLLEATFEKEGLKNALGVTADSLESISAGHYVPASLITTFYELAENREKTVQWIERMYIRRDPNLPYWAIRHPSKPQWFFENSRIREIMQRIHLWD
ncbi:hypothetical protein [Robiginitalea sp. SC105]|uniref:tetratricopeptide repeat protein n=1 Tax=Robiginitalea sp. SC105 TaxID=2762332 RepID=UPI001639C15C|nr:hypothetical protein [Robiginitalea sp. SC105]MBC2840077.1 hypothetical protein [Robiginitalea sp. SC105]